MEAAYLTAKSAEHGIAQAIPTAGATAIGTAIKAVALVGRGLAAAFSPLVKVSTTFAAITKRRIAQAEAGFSEQTAQTQAKEAERKKKAAAPFDSFLADQDKAAHARGQVKAEDAQFEQLQKDSSEAGKAAMQAFIDAQAAALEMAKHDYTAVLEREKDANSEVGAEFSENERGNLSEMQRNITARIQCLESYRDRIGGGIQAAQQKQQTLESFDANTLTTLFRKNGFVATSRDKRIAKATEETAKKTKKLTQAGGLLI